MKWAIVEQNNIVSNVVVWDGSSQWMPPSNTRLIQLNENENCSGGATYAEGQNPRFILPPVVHQWTAFEFLQRFTEQELETVRQGSITDPILWRFLTFATAAQEVISSDPTTVAGMNYLVLIGLLTESRKQEILG